jgi:hypothetical protein
MQRILLAALGLLVVLPASAQDDLSIFGYFQSQFRYSTEDSFFDVPSPGQREYEDRTRTAFTIQHLNVLAAKSLSPRTSAFLNAELVNAYDSEAGFGELRIQEAWFRFRTDRRFNLRVGLLLPTFNNLNEIRNRSPLLPYILRPLPYENSLAQVSEAAAFAPQRAYVDVSGSLPATDKLTFDYAAHLGTAEEEFGTRVLSGTTPAGLDTTSFFSTGGRIGVRYDELKLGVSATYDHENVGIGVPAALVPALPLLQGAGINVSPTGVQTVPRVRLGADFSGAYRAFFFESEFIAVDLNLEDDEQALLDLLSEGAPAAGIAAPAPFLSNDFDRTFYYGLAGFNFFDDRFYVYGTYNSVDGGPTNNVRGRIGYLSAGAGYRPVFGVTLKAQYVALSSEGTPFLDFNGDYVFLGASVLF